MTCHHKKKSVYDPFTGEDRIKRDLLPKGDMKRCRCEVADAPRDHCHAPADQEDMLCQWCRRICFAESPSYFRIAIQHTPPECDLATCPEEAVGRASGTAPENVLNGNTK